VNRRLRDPLDRRRIGGAAGDRRFTTAFQPSTSPVPTTNDRIIDDVRRKNHFGHDQGARH